MKRYIPPSNCNTALLVAIAFLVLGLLATASKGVSAAPLAVPSVEWVETARGTQRPDRALHSMIYDEVNQMFWLYGGVEGNYNNRQFRDTLYKLDATNPDAQWEAVSMSGTKPPALGYHTAVYDRGRQRMYVYGGITDRGTTTPTVAPGGTVWILDLRNPDLVAWTRQGSQGMPVDRFGHAAAYVPELDALVVSGGAQSFQTLTSSNYALLLGERPVRWVRLANAGFNVRAGHLLHYHTESKRLLAYGGASDLTQPTTLSDVVYLDISQGLEAESSWRRMTTSAPAVRRAFMAGAFDPIRNLWWVQGGIESANRYSRDLSALDLSVDPPTWVRTQTVYNGPLERFAHVAAWDGPRDRAVFHGGTPNGNLTTRDTRVMGVVANVEPTATTTVETATATASATGTATVTGEATATETATSATTPTEPPEVTDTPVPTATGEDPATATASTEPSATPSATNTGTPTSPDPTPGRLYLPFAQKPR